MQTGPSGTRHPAAEAWLSLVGSGRHVTAVEALKETKTSAVYRLQLSDGARIVAKRGEVDRIAGEHAVYAALGELPIRTPVMYGRLTANRGTAWLFTEDAGSMRVRNGLADHRELVARWLAGLHVSAAQAPAVRSLPARGGPYYLGTLEAALAAVVASLTERSLPARSRSVLESVRRRGEAILRNWQHVIDLCAVLPETLAHGDLTKKNLRVRALSGDIELLVIDWESAGLGFAAVDLARVDHSSYAAAVGAAWPDVDLDAVRQAARGGRLLRLVLALSWAALRLPYASIDRPIAQMEIYVDWLDEALADGGVPR